MMSDMPQHKVVLIGDINVGKTSMFMRFKTGEWQEVDERTRRECEIKKEILVDGGMFEITLHDTAGMERYEGTVPPSYFKSASAVIFVYAINNQESIANVQNWAESVTPQRLQYVNTDANIVKILVGNKNDLDERLVSMQRAREVGGQCGVKPEHIFEISTMTGEGFDQIFVSVARAIMANRERVNSGGSDVLTLRTRPAPKKLSGCCRST